MRAAIYIVVILASLSQFAYLQRLAADDADRTADEREIRESMFEITRAFVARDPKPFERIYNKQYISIRNKPIYNAREHLLAMVKSDAALIKAGKSLEFETISYEHEGTKLRFFGRTAIVNVGKKNLWRYRESKCLTRYQATEVWLKRAERWQLFAGAVTTFQCDAMPWHPPHPAVAAIASQTAPSDGEPTTENEIRDLLEEVSLAKGGRTGSDAAAKLFAENFVSTNVKGEVGTDRTQLVNAFRSATSEQWKEDEQFQVFDDTVIYTFRIRLPAKTAGGTHYTVVFVKPNDRWIIAASHAAKATGD